MIKVIHSVLILLLYNMINLSHIYYNPIRYEMMIHLKAILPAVLQSWNALHTLEARRYLLGNAWADAAAQTAATKTKKTLIPQCLQNCNSPGPSMSEIQTAADVSEHQLWMDAKWFQLPNGLWISCDGHTVAPKQLLPWSAHVSHHFTHTAKGRMHSIISSKLVWARFCCFWG